jgi:hypothetical protein
MDYLRAKAGEATCRNGEIGQEPGSIRSGSASKLRKHPEGEGQGALTFFRQAKHSAAGIDTSDCRIRETLPKWRKKLTGAHSEDENRFWSREVLQVRGPTSVELAPGKERLHP